MKQWDLGLIALIAMGVLFVLFVVVYSLVRAGVFD